MKDKYFYLTLFFSIFLATLPFVLVFLKLGSYPHIPPRIADDSIYYFTRSIDIYHGHPFIGNPYLIEHKDDVSPVFFVSDWIYSAPLFLGFSLNQAIFINQIFWFLVFGFLVHHFLGLFSVSKKWLPYITCIVMLSVYWYLVKPVSLQVVAPFFLGFVILLYYFLNNHNSWKYRLMLGVFSGIALYTYTYLAQIMGLTFIVIFIVSLFPKYRMYISGIFFSGLIALFLSIPFIFYTWLQIHQTFYAETLGRLGLIYTHSLGSLTLVYFISLLLLIIFILRNNNYFSECEVFMLVSVTGVLSLALISNIFTGVDFELSQHIAKFIDIWLALVTFIILSRINFNNYFHGIEIGSLLLFLPTLLILISGIYLQSKKWENLYNFPKSDAYLPVVDWLNKNNIKNEVIFADDKISIYIPMMTENYILFHYYSSLHILSNDEVVDRYLLSKVFTDLTKDELKKDFINYAGVGESAHKANLVNRNIKICLIVKKIINSISCPILINPFSLKGENYFVSLIDRFNYIKRNKEHFFKLYNVDYILLDKDIDNWDIEKLNKKVIKIDDRFSVINMSI